MVGPLAFTSLLAEMPRAQLLMVAGFVMLGWVLARRQIRVRRRAHHQDRAANQAILKLRDHREPLLPLGGAPVETQRWHVAMFDLQRDLKGELDTRIAIVQTLIRQVDERIEQLSRMEADSAQNTMRVITPPQRPLDQP